MMALKSARKEALFMKKFLAVLLGALLVCCAVSACAQDAFEVLPAPERDS